MAALERFSADALTRFAVELLQAAGLDAAPADAVANTLVNGDLMGHDTHGLALLAPYVKELENGGMTRSGAPQVLSDRGASILWDGMRLPGPWLVMSGLDILEPRARQYGTATLVIRRSHHIASLASYLLRATDAGLVLLLTCSDPSGQSVAPHGGTRAVFTPNPIAAGIPTSSTPFLIDVSSSITTNAMSARMHKSGQQFDEACMLDAQGHTSRDPSVLSAQPPGTILPLGGTSSGHKGFGLALLIESLTGGLAGHGRADPADGWGATVFMSLYDPTAFGGCEDFVRQTDWLAQACRNNPPRPGVEAVRMPGDRGLARSKQQLSEGLQLHPSIAPMLRECAHRYGKSFPTPLTR
jgi:LDH2 family malate/lactate/ureidoglycolate dehydrogenase